MNMEGNAMKKNIVAILILMAVLLTACKSPVQMAASKSMSNSLSGTYVGKNGSVLTLYPDGTSEYYYMLYTLDDDKRAGAWSYENNTLTWMYGDKPVMAEINEKSAMSFTLEQTDGWNREQYLKASDEAKHKTAAECQQLMRDVLKQPEMDNFDEELNQSYRFGGLVIKIPFYWTVLSKDSDGVRFCAEISDSDMATLWIDYGVDIEWTQEQFEMVSIDAWKKVMETSENQDIIVNDPVITKINGLSGVQGTARTKTGANRTVSCVYEENSGTFLIVEMDTTDDTIFKYDSDYAKMINSITTPKSTVTKRTESSGTARTKQPSSSKASSGVTPELKEFLDGYEAFMDKYIAFMQKYENSDDTYVMLSDYLEMLQEYADYTEALSKYDTDKMSVTDSAYYLEVTMRVAKKLYALAMH